MKSTMEKLSSNKVRIDFVVDAEQFEKGMQAAYRKNVSKISVQGFRKGKAPRKVIEMTYGEGVFYEDAIDEIFPEVYMAAVQEHGITPVDRPSLYIPLVSGPETWYPEYTNLMSGGRISCFPFLKN